MIEVSRKGKTRTLIDEWLDEGEEYYNHKIALLRGMSRHGYSRLEIAGTLGITQRTLENYVKRYSDVKEALSMGNADLYFEVLNFIDKSILEDDSISKEMRLNYAFKMESKYGHRYRTKQDKSIDSDDAKRSINYEVEKAKALKDNGVDENRGCKVIVFDRGRRKKDDT